MKTYEAPKAQLIVRNDLDVICTSDLLFPIIPMGDGGEPIEE